VAEVVHEQQPDPARQPRGETASLAGTPHAVLDLQALVGNHAVTQLVQRHALQRQSQITDVDVKKRFDLPVRHYTQEQVRALYLGAGMVYSGEAVWHEESKSWIVDRSQLIDFSAKAGEKAETLPSDADLDRFENSLDAILKSEPLPEEGTSSAVETSARRTSTQRRP
jgi:hypothetical protein